MIALGMFLCTLGIQFYASYKSAGILIELNRLYAALVYVRRKAILEGRVQRVLCSQKSASYVIDGEEKKLSGASFGILEKVQGPPGKPRRTLITPITFQENTLKAYPDGTLSAGALYMTNVDRSCLYALTTDASAITGLRRYRYENLSSRWELIE